MLQPWRPGPVITWCAVGGPLRWTATAAQVLPRCPPHVRPVGALHTIHQVTLQAGTVAWESCRHVWQPHHADSPPLKQTHKGYNSVRAFAMGAHARNEPMGDVQQTAITKPSLMSEHGAPGSPTCIRSDASAGGERRQAPSKPSRPSRRSCMPCIVFSSACLQHTQQQLRVRLHGSQATQPKLAFGNMLTAALHGSRPFQKISHVQHGPDLGISTRKQISQSKLLASSKDIQGTPAHVGSSFVSAGWSRVEGMLSAPSSLAPRCRTCSL